MGKARPLVTRFFFFFEDVFSYIDVILVGMTTREISCFWKIPETTGGSSPAPSNEEEEYQGERKRNNSYDDDAPYLPDVGDLRDQLQEKLEGGNVTFRSKMQFFVYSPCFFRISSFVILSLVCDVHFYDWTFLHNVTPMLRRVLL